MKPNRERGAVAVELGLCMPVVFLILLGGVHLSRAVHARNRITDAVSVAARLAAVGGQHDQGTVAAIVTQRLQQGQSSPLCAGNPTVNVAEMGAAPFSRLEVTVTCALPPPFGKNILGSIGPASVTATASMPLW